MPTITEESWNLHIEQEPNFLSTPTPTEWRIQIFKITGGGGHPDPEIGGEGGWGWSPKKIFSALLASVWYKNKGTAWSGPLVPLPWICRCPQPVDELLWYFM